MGMADVVPGVSGGTVALALGIYRRLVTAISRFDGQAIHYVKSRDWSGLAAYVDLKFLATLGFGIAAGFVLTVKLLAHFLEDEQSRSYLLAAFLGMIIAALVIVVRMIVQINHVKGDRGKLIINGVAALLGTGVALLVSQLSPARSGEELAFWYLFLCGVFGICAMILPGISGALILMLLGAYEYLIQVARQILSFEELGRNLVVAMCFAGGCVTGLIVFSRVLRILLERRPAVTLSFLSGLIAGSLPQLWPFQINTTPDVPEFKLRVYRATWPESLDATFWLHAAVAVIALAAILIFEHLANRATASAI